jgi:hypothetical protein
MKTFYGVMFGCFVVGMLIVCFYAPWTTTPADSAGAHTALGYAPIWSSQFAGVAGARVDSGGLGILTAVVAFFSIVIGGSAYFFRGKHGKERDLD